MKRLIYILSTIFLFFVCCFSTNVTAQTRIDSVSKQDSVTKNVNSAASVPAEDDEFNIFLFAMAAAFLAIILGGTIIGAFAASVLLLLIFAMSSLGILSISVVTGLYKRSFQAGFKTFLLIVFGLGGIFFGIGGFWLIVKLFELNFSVGIIFIAGSLSGGLAGIFLGIVVFKLILVSTKYFKERLSLTS